MDDRWKTSKARTASVVVDEAKNAYESYRLVARTSHSPTQAIHTADFTDAAIDVINQFKNMTAATSKKVNDPKVRQALGKAALALQKASSELELAWREAGDWQTAEHPHEGYGEL